MDGLQVRQYVDGLRTNTVAATATGGWVIYRWGWQFTGREGLDEAYVPFFGAFGAACYDAMVARWSANPLGMLWPEMEAAFVMSGGMGPPVAARRAFIIAAASLMFPHSSCKQATALVASAVSRVTVRPPETSSSPHAQAAPAIRERSLTPGSSPHGKHLA